MNLSETYNLKVLYPEIARQWHPVKNGNLTPDKVTPGSTKKIWWVCPKGHEWQTIISNRSKGHGCPYCCGRYATKEYNLSVSHPELAKQWHPTKNSNLTPDKVTHGSRIKVWWVCDRGHEWRAVLNSRSQGRGCPYCSVKRAGKEYNLSILQPKLAQQWHPTKNGDIAPDKMTPLSRKKFWWVCDNGHEWQSSFDNRRKGRNCPYCSGRRACKENNLSVIYPKIAGQWHPVKNGNLTPDKITPNSHKKVWWLCDKGHEWQATIANRSRGNGCPYCSGKRASIENNLSVIHPKIAKQWHPVKNGGLNPEKVTPYASLKVWWKCDSGHEWLGSINIVSNYKNNPPCPFCAGKRVSKDNNLLAVHPGLAKQWHPVKNGNLTPDKVIKGAGRKVWWKCDKGHEWKALISQRTTGVGCPKCASHIPSKEHNLMINRPDISNQWHPIRNGGLTPEDVTPRSIKKVWWMCEKGHEWEDIIRARTKYGNPCPYCYADRYKEYNLLVLYPNIAGQWHPAKNGQLSPGDVTPGSAKKVWWVCDKGHEWRTSIVLRTRGCNCPYCSGNYPSADYNLQVINPALARQWHPTKNGYLKPDKVTPGSAKKVWWRCDNGHEWKRLICVRSRYNQECPYCSRRKVSQKYNLLKTHPEIARQWHPTKNRDLTPVKVTPGSKKKAWWVCDKGHEWLTVINYRTGKSTRCPYCAGKKK